MSNSGNHSLDKEKLTQHALNLPRDARLAILQGLCSRGDVSVITTENGEDQRESNPFTVALWTAYFLGFFHDEEFSMLNGGTIDTLNSSIN